MSPQLSVRSALSHFDCSFRIVVRHIFVLAAGLLVLSLPGLALADENGTEADDDSFVRPGFYIGIGGSYQYNVFQNRIEDVISDALVDNGNLDPGTNVGFDIDDSAGINALVGYRLNSWFALELEYEWVDQYDVDGSADIPAVGNISGRFYSIEGHTLTANTKWIIPSGRFQPYFLLGGGVAISDVDRGDIFDIQILEDALDSAGIDIKQGKQTNAAGRAGLGLDIYLTKNILLNTEASVVLTTLKQPDVGDIEDLNYMSFTAGLQYRF